VKKSMWMVRSASGGRLADECVEKKVVAIGWAKVGDLNAFPDKEALRASLRQHRPNASPGNEMNSASQLLRFRDEIAVGDRVITYDSGTRTYHVGTIIGEYTYSPNRIEGYPNIRSVKWEGRVDRDKLTVNSRNTLGSTLTLFKVPEKTAQEVEQLATGHAVPEESPEVEDAEEEEDLLEGYKEEAFEITKDRINRLDWEQLQELVAGLLRAMGYKTRVAPLGPDRGVDIMASPDGFGFESPRIMVEVKHRGDSIGAQEIRSFIGGRHKDDKGMYVSTGGFTKDARYEAERANIPVFLMDLNELVKAIYRHYEGMDIDSQTLIPLKKIYWPMSASKPKLEQP
jgi:restriction system protein